MSVDWSMVCDPPESQTVYISGPMTGLPEYNFPAFRRAAIRWRIWRYRILNPADYGVTEGMAWQDYLRRDLRDLLSADVIAVLLDWQKSKGASLEVYVARALGIPVRDAFSGKPLSESILEEAHRLVHGDRQEAYGHPLDDFTRTGRMWAAILGLPEVTPEKVALCMVAVKVSRYCNRPKRDSLVDGAGYFATIELIEQERARRGENVGQNPTNG